MLHVDERLPRRLIGDVGRLAQVLLNFCSNAIRFTESGYIALGVTLDHVPPPLSGPSGPKAGFEVGGATQSDGIPRSGEVEAVKAAGGKAQKPVWVRFSVEDTGIGIEEGELAKVFEPFVQVSQPRHHHLWTRCAHAIFNAPHAHTHLLLPVAFAELRHEAV